MKRLMGLTRADLAGACLVVGLSAGCGTADHCSGSECAAVGAGSGASAEPADFCQLWTAHFSDYIERCGCGAPAAQRFRDLNQALCASDSGLGTLSVAVKQGSLVYHPAAAEALFARLTERMTCDKSPFLSLALDSREVYSLAGTFTGTRAVGEHCLLPVSYKGGVSDCAEGVCAPDGSGGGACIALVSSGQECDGSGDKGLAASVPRLCHKMQPADADGEYETAFDSLTCLESVPGGPKTCGAGLAAGVACAGDQSCLSSRCLSSSPGAPPTCAARVAAGQACSRSSDCQSGACQYPREPAVCGAERLANGETCDYDDAACVSGSCNGQADGRRVCGPKPSVESGSECQLDADCLTGLCRAGRCFARVCEPYLG